MSSMARLVRSELGKLWIPATVTLVALTVVACVLTCTLYTGYSLDYDLEAWEIGREIIDFLFPVFVVVPLCWSVYYERKDHFLVYTLPRVGKAAYLVSKWVAAGICAFAIIFVPYLLSAVFALYVKPPITPMNRTGSPFTHIYLELFVNSPMVYAFALSAWKGVLAVMVMSLGFLLSLYVGNIFIVLTGPFVYSIVENFIWAIAGVPQYRLVTSFEPTINIESTITGLSTLVGPLVLLVVMAVVWFIFTRVRHQVVYQI